MKTFAEKILDFNNSLEFQKTLPNKIQIMNPFREDPAVKKVTEEFYTKYYSDNNQRKIILGINPGRFGAGVTGIPFTDTKRLEGNCKINWSGKPTNEPSSVFIYDLIKAYGGVKKFYSKFYINSVSPLGFTKTQDNGKVKNYNYYDSKVLKEAVRPFILDCIKRQLDFGIDKTVCFCLGCTKNFRFLKKVNEEYKFFDNIVPLEHPAFITVYDKKRKKYYIKKYINKFKNYE